MSTTKTSLLLTGATGYLGSSILSRYLQRPDVSSFDISILVRNAEKAAKIKNLNLGINVVVGSHSDSALLEKLASQADVVIAASDVDDLAVAQSILRGLKKRFDKTGKAPILIHTSGTGVYVNFAEGRHDKVEVFDDANPDQIEKLSPTAPHRHVDLEVLAADAAGYIQSLIILPATVWGTPSGPLFDAGVAHLHSIQIPYAIKAALARGQGGMVNEGKNVWPHAEVNEVADLYSVVLDAFRNGHPKAGHGRDGFYNAVVGQELYTMRELATTISEALVALGKAIEVKPSTFATEELGKYFGPAAGFFGSNCRCLATRSEAIGWVPKKHIAEMYASVKPETEALIAEV